ncbi:pyruvate, phosphate dikinase [Candidatus Fermentibacteria bacterium]|nr:pyruvate, phosphate dikinase [Candidatus Fermentibacteria bacterium]
MNTKRVFFFGAGEAEGSEQMRNLLGGKGAGLADMTRLGLPVPPGFTISTEVCTYFYEHGETYPGSLSEEVDDALLRVERIMDRRFGDPQRPLLVSVRSGARASMPGMMDTVLNLGLNDATVQGLIDMGGEPRFAYDSYRRFVQMYGDVVLGLKPASKNEEDPFEVIIQRKKAEVEAIQDLDLSTDDLKDLVARFKAAIKSETGHSFPEDAREQLWGAIGAVFCSWNNDRAIAYRRLNDIPVEWGTAVNIQAMVFGNMGPRSGTGVAFTRNPATGERQPYGEYLMNAQGEDVVAGIRTPLPLSDLQHERPEVYDQLTSTFQRLEQHYREMQDVEFTIQDDKLWMLQTRSGKRTGFAAVRIAVEMAEEGLISEEEAIRRVNPEQLNHLLRPVFDPEEKRQAVAADGRLLAKGLNAGPGAACGKVVFHAVDAQEWKAKDQNVILVRIETSPEDIRGMHAAEGILTARGGMTSHAALVARQMGKVCVAGCSALRIDYAQSLMLVGDHTIRQGDVISIDGFTGEVILGELKTRPSEVVQVLIEGSLPADASIIYQKYEKLMSWADTYRRLRIRTNADQPDQSRNARAFGAEGIGLCRTEHMFFGGHRIDAMREMILAEDTPGREQALARLLPMQREDFIGIFRAMDGLPVTIRTLDPPLHEFLPHGDAGIQELAASMQIPAYRLKAKVEALRESNPMLGHRGCRLGIFYPEITAMQARAIVEAACIVAKEGVRVIPEIMIPVVFERRELQNQERIVRKVAEDVFAEQGIRVDYLVGTMIELPRAAITADQIAKNAEFFSFGTNDLTQTTLGISRDDAGSFLPYYVEHDIVPHDPFESIDSEGVGELMRIGVERGRKTRPELKVGICGEHGGDPATVEFCHEIGLDYVSCSPFRVPIARLAAARAALACRD